MLIPSRTQKKNPPNWRLFQNKPHPPSRTTKQKNQNKTPEGTKSRWRNSPDDKNFYCNDYTYHINWSHIYFPLQVVLPVEKNLPPDLNFCPHCQNSPPVCMFVCMEILSRQTYHAPEPPWKNFSGTSCWTENMEGNPPKFPYLPLKQPKGGNFMGVGTFSPSIRRKGGQRTGLQFLHFWCLFLNFLGGAFKESVCVFSLG